MRRKRNTGCDNCCFFTGHKGNENGTQYCFHPKNTYKKFETYSGKLEIKIKGSYVEQKWNKDGYCKKFIKGGK